MATWVSWTTNRCVWSLWNWTLVSPINADWRPGGACINLDFLFSHPSMLHTHSCNSNSSVPPQHYLTTESYKTDTSNSNTQRISSHYVAQMTNSDNKAFVINMHHAKSLPQLLSQNAFLCSHQLTLEHTLRSLVHLHINLWQTHKYTKCIRLFSTQSKTKNTLVEFWRSCFKS